MPRSRSTSKTRKAAAKRFKITATGKVIGNSNGRRHLARKKNRKRMRRLGAPTVMADCEAVRVKECMPFG